MADFRAGDGNLLKTPGPRSSSQAWRDYFRHNNSYPEQFPIEASPPLDAPECALIRASLQQFQLGEGSAGARLLARGERWAAQRGDPWFPESLREFVREEQRHSTMLGQFMDRNRIPRLDAHWVDGAFRRLRAIAGLDAALSVLSTAEVIAVPYYRALAVATSSPTLRSLCDRILADEAAHLIYQGRSLGLLRGSAQRWKWIAHRCFLEGTLLVVWREHRPVFQRSQYTFARLRSEAIDCFGALRSAAATAARDAHNSIAAPATAPRT